MTRNREVRCEDLFDCDHEPETPVTDEDGEIIQWVCRCGKVTKQVDLKPADSSLLAKLPSP